MPNKQMGQKERSGKQKQQQQGNFGQTEAREQKEKETQLSHMGETSHQDEHKDKSD